MGAIGGAGAGVEAGPASSVPSARLMKTEAESEKRATSCMVIFAFVVGVTGSTWMVRSRLPLRNLMTGFLPTWSLYHVFPGDGGLLSGVVSASFRAYCSTDLAAERNALSSHLKAIGSLTIARI